MFNTRKTLESDPKRPERYLIYNKIKRKPETSRRHCTSHSAESILAPIDRGHRREKRSRVNDRPIENSIPD